MSKLRLGVIGAGSWVVASHLPTLKQRPEVELVGVCRKGGELLERVRSTWGFTVASEDYRDVLDAGVDIVIVASPAALHYEHAKAALESGAHVLVEKPFVLTARDAWELVDVAASTDRHVVVSLGYNYRPMVAAAQDLLDRHGGVGQIESLLVSMCSGTRGLLTEQGAYPKAAPEAVPDPETWTDPTLSGGGYAQAQLSHALGAALFLTQLRSQEVFAFMYKPQHGRVELDDAFAVRYRGGAIGTVTGASAHPGFHDERDQLHIRVVGDEGHLDMAFEEDLVALHRPDTGTVRAELPDQAGAYDCVGPPNALVDLALGRDVPNRSPAELGARIAELLEAAYTSAQGGGPVRVDDATSGYLS